jgi:hypothetical protein
MVLTSMTEAMLRELAHGLDPADLLGGLARRIALVEQVRTHVRRLAEERRREDARHRDALAVIDAEVREWQDGCPHPCHTFGRACPVCGLVRAGGNESGRDA